MGPLADGAVRWQRLESLFSQALALEPAERSAFLDRAAAADPTLRAELDALLAADAEAETFLADAVGAGLELFREAREARESADRPAARSERPQERLGAHRLLSEIGRGGMSRVFLAERVDGLYGQQVAIKLLLPGMDSQDLLRRFETERRILARLEHPHIGRLYDGGTSAAGQPYLVMEVIDGRPIDRFCDEEGLGVTERLRLFQTVCRAVHFAHQNLVVHRDLKPSNVLVTADGTPKLLDFGIAKLLDPDGDADGGGGEVTRTALRPMTPRYASPEQVRGKTVTTASDVFSLGVLLYRLLAGRLPFPPESLPPGELERRIAEDDPPPPSAVAERPEWRRRLAGDLDTVVLCALAKEPERRYHSAEQLALDIERHLAGHPVSARPATFAYRTSRFLRRHALVTAATAAFATLLVTFAVSTAVQSSRIAAERDRAERTARVLIDLFEVADPARGGTVTAREILELGTTRVRREVPGPPALRATLLETIGGAYRKLGLYDRARPLLAEALTVRRADDGGDPATLARTIDQLGVIHALQGHYEDAEPLLAEALALRERILEPGDPELATSLNNLALLRHDRGDYAGAAPLYRQALAADARAAHRAGDDPAGGAGADTITRSNFALLLYDMGRYEEAERYFRAILEHKRRLLGPDDPELAVDLGHLGTTLTARGRLTAAEPLLRQALELVSTNRGADHPDRARALDDLAELLVARGRPRTAEPLARRALEIRLRRLGKTHPETAASHLTLGRVLAASGRQEMGEAELGLAVDAFRATLPADHPSLGEALLEEGRLRVARGRCRAARPALLGARSILRRALGDGDPRVQSATELLAACPAPVASGAGQATPWPARRAGALAVP